MLIFFIFLLAGIIKGIIGLGLPTIAMGLLTLSMPPAAAASLLLIPSLVTNVWQLFLGRDLLPLLKRLSPLLLGLILGTLFSFFPDLTTTASWPHIALGLILCIYGFWGLTPIQLPAPKQHEKKASLLVGYLTGMITAATGVFVIPAVPYLQSLKMNRNELIQALGLSFTASTLALTLQLMLSSTLQPVDAGRSALALIPALGGMYAGQYLRQRISEQVFRRCFFSGLILLGGYMSISKLAMEGSL